MERRFILWLPIRRLLFFLFVCGCVVSMWTSGRLGVRLIADGMVSFVFIPVFQLAAFAIVYRRTRRPLPFVHAADRFFAGNRPWLAWLVAFAALRCLLTPIQAGAPPQVLWWVVQATVVATILWSAYVDYGFFREVLSPPGDGAWDLVLQRAIGWTLSVVYFFGIAIWPHVVERIA